MKIVENIIAAMLKEVEKHHLELMRRYPLDLIKHDKCKLENLIAPGAKIAWMVGDAHTHMIFLGIHKTENDMIRCLTNLCNNDKFYVLDIKSLADDGFNLKELTKEKFTLLANTPIHYSASGFDKYSMSVMDGKDLIGGFEIAVEGGWEERIFNCTVRPKENLNKLQSTALKVWASYGVNNASGTLFSKTVFNYIDKG